MPDRRTASRDADAERREEQVLARYRLRMARAASAIALIVVAAMAFHVVAHLGPAPVALWLLLAAAAAISTAIRLSTREGAAPLPLWAFYVWTGAVIAFDSAVVYLSGDASSEIYLSYLLAVLFAAAILPVWGAALTLVVAVAAYLAVLLAIDGDIGRPELVMRLATFAVVGLLGSYLAREAQGEIALRVRQEQRAETLARDRGELLTRATSAQEGERARIARELHDGPIQALSAVTVQLGLIEAATDPEPSRSRIDDARTALRSALADLRRVIADLRPSALDDVGLVPAVHDLARRECDAHDIELDWEVAGPVRRLAPAVETALFRILQEGVNNVVRHSRARSARVSIAFTEGQVRASVEDDGVGFDPDASERAEPDGHVGLLGMQERAALLGGRLEIASRPGRGARVTAVIPDGAVSDG